MDDHIGKVRRPLAHQLLPHNKGHQAGILAEDEKVQGVALLPGGLHQIPVAQGKGVGVHNNGGGDIRPCGLFQGLQVIGKSVPPVFHKDQGALYPGDLVKAQALKEPGGLDLGIEEQVAVAPAQLVLHQMGDDLVEEPLPLVVRADGKAPEGIAEAAARGNDLPILVQHGADIVQIGVPGNALSVQQCVYRGQGPFVTGENLGNGVFTHGSSPSKNAASGSWPADRRSLRGRDSPPQTGGSSPPGHLFPGRGPLPGPL